MQCIRKNHKRSVFYDSETKRYIKVFTPKLELKIKYWLGLRKYPGLNFAHIANRLEELGISTPKVVHAEKYKVVTEEIAAPTVREYLEKKPDPALESRLVDQIATVLNAGISFFDFHYDNFMYKDGESIALDLEGYSDSIFLSRGRKGVLYRIEKHLGKDFRNEVEKRWTNITPAQRVSEVFQTLRGRK